MNAVENCLVKLNHIIDINKQMMTFYTNLLNCNELNEINPSLQFLLNQKKRFINSAKFEMERLSGLHPETKISDVSKYEFNPQLINSKNVDTFLLKLITAEQQFANAYLEIISQLNPEGSVYQRLINHVDEIRVSSTMLQRNITHQQVLLSA